VEGEQERKEGREREGRQHRRPAQRLKTVPGPAKAEMRRLRARVGGLAGQTLHTSVPRKGPKRKEGDVVSVPSACAGELACETSTDSSSDLAASECSTLDGFCGSPHQFLNQIAAASQC
jgi:hypothetical protein